MTSAMRARRAYRRPPAPSRSYDRARDLPRLLPMWPFEISDASIDGAKRIVARLRCALRAERRRGLSGHWTYDLARHAQLRDALRAEQEALTRRKPDCD